MKLKRLIEELKIIILNMIWYNKIQFISGLSIVSVILIDLCINRSLLYQYVLLMLCLSIIVFFTKLTSSIVKELESEKVDHNKSSSHENMISINDHIVYLLLYLNVPKRIRESIPVSLLNPAEPKKLLNRLDKEIDLFVEEIVQRFIKSWYYQIVSIYKKDDEFIQEIQIHIKRILSELAFNNPTTSIETVCNFIDVLRNHLNKYHINSSESINYPKHPVTQGLIDKDEYLLKLVTKLFESLGYSATKTSDKSSENFFVYKCIFHIISSQVFNNLILTLSNPQMIHNLIYDRPFISISDGNIHQERTESIIEEKSSTMQNINKYFRAISAPVNPVNPLIDKKSMRNTVSVDDGPKKAVDLTGYSISSNKDVAIPQSGKISWALGGLFSATAGPLLPDNLAFKPFNKMWKSNSNETSPKKSLISTESTFVNKQKQILKRKRSNSVETTLNIDSRNLVINLEQKRSRLKRSHSITTISISPTIDNDTSRVINSKRKLKRKYYSYEYDETTLKKVDNIDRDNWIKQSIILDKQTTGSNYFGDDELEYEDNQDLESTIGKIRQLLAERDSSGADESDDVFELPFDNSLFKIVRIALEYDGVYSISYIVRNGGDFEYMIRRKFEDFINLEKSLNLNTSMKGEVKKGPLSTTDNNSPIFLEIWLKSLCENPVIGFSAEMKEFLCFDDETLNKIERSESSSPRIEKFLAKTVSGVFNSIKEVLPNFDDDDEDMTRNLAVNEDIINKDMSDILYIPISDNSDFQFNLMTYIKHYDEIPSQSQDFPVLGCDDSRDKFFFQGDVQSNINDGSIVNKVMDLGSDFLKYLYNEDGSSKYWINKEFSFRIIKFSFAKIVNDIIGDVLRNLTLESTSTKIWSSIRNFLWPNQQLKEETNDDDSTSLKEDVIKDKLADLFSNGEINQDLALNVLDLLVINIIESNNRNKSL